MFLITENLPEQDVETPCHFKYALNKISTKSQSKPELNQFKYLNKLPLDHFHHILLPDNSIESINITKYSFSIHTYIYYYSLYQLQ